MRFNNYLVFFIKPVPVKGVIDIMSSKNACYFTTNLLMYSPDRQLYLVCINLSPKVVSEVRDRLRLSALRQWASNTITMWNSTITPVVSPTTEWCHIHGGRIRNVCGSHVCRTTFFRIDKEEFRRIMHDKIDEPANLFPWYLLISVQSQTIVQRNP